MMNNQLYVVQSPASGYWLVMEHRPKRAGGSLILRSEWTEKKALEAAKMLLTHKSQKGEN